MKATRTTGLGQWMGFVILLFATGVLPIQAADLDQTVTFSIPAGKLSDALILFSRQSHVQVLSSGDRASRETTAGLSGAYTVRAALDALLQPAHLKYRATSADTVILESPADSQLAFDLAAGPLDYALDQFRRQSFLKVVAPKELIAGKKVKSVRGTMAPADALRRLLKASGLTFVRGSDDSITIQAITAAAPTAADAEGPVAADVSVQSQRVIQVYTPGGNVDIPRTIDDTQPYYIFDSQQIEDSGALNVEDFLKQRLTMNTTAQTNSQVYGLTNGGLPAGTTSSINLRGLGTNETLILVDGHRMAGITLQGNSEQPDVNGIPLAAIDRIEVLPSGASAIYGGSAMGGVINIILKKNYQGGEFKYSYENVTSGSAPISTADGSYGFSLEDGKTNIMLTGHYSNEQPLLLGDRVNVVERGVNTVLQNNPSLLLENEFLGGTTPNIRSASSNPNGTLANLTLANGTPLNSPITYIPAGTSASTPASVLDAGLLANAGKQNLNLAPGTGEFGLQQPLGSSARVESAMATVRREMSPWLNAFAEFSVERNEGSSVYNPLTDGQALTVVQGSSAQYSYIPGLPTNPHSPFQQAVIISIPNALAVPLDTRSTTRAMTTGLTATLPFSWTSEMDYTWSENSYTYLYNLTDQTALDAYGEPYFLTNTLGALFSGALNPFVDTGKYPLNLSSYLQPNTYGSSSTLNDLALRASGPVFSLPWGSPTLTVGLEHRKEGYPSSTQYSVFNPDTAVGLISNNYTNFFGQSESTKSLYAEADFPLITKKNAFPGVRSLELQVADRIESYSVHAGTTSEFVVPNGEGIGNPTSAPYHCYTPALDAACQIPVPGSTTSYSSNNATLGLKYKPIEDVILRASHATAFLPPTYSQLLPNPMMIPGGDTITDPKTGASYPVNIISGGNPELKPDHEKDWDIGLIYEPQGELLKGFRVDLEYYQITQLGYITSLSGDLILNTPSLSSRVTRSPVTGQVTLINESLINATEYKTEGWDLSIDYRKPTSFGIFGVRSAATVIEHETRQYSPTVPGLDYVDYPEAGGEAKLKANTTLSWAYRRWTLGWTTTWFGSYNIDGPYGISPVDIQTQGGSRIPAQIYHEFVGSYAVGNSGTSRLLSNLTVQVGIKNIFNTLPPFQASNPPFYYSPYGDLRLRDVWLSVRKGFGH